MSEQVRYSPSWLGLREDADARARAGDLAVLLGEYLLGEDQAGEDQAGEDQAVDPVERPVITVHDLGCGTGSMARWLVPLLPGPQHWVLHDRDPELLALAAGAMPAEAGDGSAVTVELRPGDLTCLSEADLHDATLVVGSALLDLLTLDEVDRLAEICAQLRCAALFTLSVTGLVELTPAEPLDTAVAEAFNAHQRRSVDGRRLLGPDAVDAVAASLTRHGARVEVRSSPWTLAPAQSELIADWLRGWVGAAVEQRPELPVGGYLGRRLDAADAGELGVLVGHGDVLARWDRTVSDPGPVPVRDKDGVRT